MQKGKKTSMILWAGDREKRKIPEGFAGFGRKKRQTNIPRCRKGRHCGGGIARENGDHGPKYCKSLELTRPGKRKAKEN